MADATASTSNNVVIVGAGLAGLSLALGLTSGTIKNSAGKDNDRWRVHLVEKQFNFSRTGATFGLQPNGQKALKELAPGIVEELNQVGLFIPQSGGTMLGWWNVRDALLARVQQEASKPDGTAKISLHTGYLLQDVLDSEDGVNVTFQKHKKQADSNSIEQAGDSNLLTLQASILIGADGVNSSVRDHLGLPKAKWTNVVMWRSRLYIPPNKDDPKSTPAADILRPYLDIPIVPLGVRLRGCTNYAFFNFHQKTPGTMALVANYKLDQEQADKSMQQFVPGTSVQSFLEAQADDEKEVQEIRAMAELCDHDGLHHPIKQKVVVLPEEDGKGWGGKGRITLLGDAAHALRPASGQGGSMAFEDAVVLCRVLQKKFGSSKQDQAPTKTEIEQALQEYENTRLPRVRKLWVDQWERAEATYKNITVKPWDEEFSNWVFQGV
ncbi:heptyl-3-hydroxy-4(1H)-quinolone synthase [Seminavis robusta]|uniref:Heptyl-3-hydroxy-4(1H)-quinolone synthase n=1 Tax=Seminavis robusta TaxID=568900 RepID=A0A9N8DE93_9STRA|nr:heptyl-3-hydroxy-4(1H)-quinolone synthase [Seminavis robusta]|eukprot:Sro53_g031560.1 heptyl-3-hydroxy-4(1H)-quinolone synthase (438) ;mRNA; f:122587-123996